jgi:hypothetical protein
VSVRAAKRKRFDVVDRDGAYPPIPLARRMFEELMRRTPSFASTYYLAWDGTGYRGANVHQMWLGFALGLRCAHRATGAEYPAALAADMAHGLPSQDPCQ